jgi:hypothetical protein
MIGAVVCRVAMIVAHVAEQETPRKALDPDDERTAKVAP